MLTYKNTFASPTETEKERVISSCEVTIILPMYNEADRIEHCVREVKTALDRFAHSYEITIAEDGSTDGTEEIAARLAVEDKRVIHLHSDQRIGKGAALKRAIHHASGEVIVFVDADLPISLDTLPVLLKLTKKSQGMTIGSRAIQGAVTKRPIMRSVLSKFYNLFVRALFQDGVYDHQCGYKAFSKTMLVDIIDKVDDNSWFFDTELIVRAKKAGYPIIEMPLTYMETRNKGEYKINILHASKQMGLALLKLWRSIQI
jgi:glycosyltransferase involved in cell wall biosynthesis